MSGMSSPRSARGSARGKKKPVEAPNALPYQDKVDLLLEKQRYLMQLKVIEQERLAKEWKSKYDSLVDKVGSSAGKTGDYRALESAAMENENSKPVSNNIDVSDKSAAGMADTTVIEKKILTELPAKTDSEGMQSLLMNRPYSWIVDFSNLAIKDTFLRQLNKDVFSMRGIEYYNIQVVNLSRCDLEDTKDGTIELGTIVSKPSVQALDLSNNNLGALFLTQLISSLKSRRRTPQYLMLQGNMPIAHHSLIPLIKNLTDSTWGLGLTLTDLNNGQLSSSGSSHSKGVGKGGKKKSSSTLKDKGGLTHDKDDLQKGLYGNDKQPHKTLEVLTTIVHNLDPHSGGGGGHKKSTAASKGQQAQTGGIMRTSSMTKMAVLALNYAQMCIESVDKLARVLALTSSTLTDLDLSFSFIGENGCKMLRDTLEYRGCQLIRLSIAGNNVGNIGIATLSESFTKNKSLTYLDSRSNNIDSAGLRSLCHGLTNTRVPTGEAPMAPLGLKVNEILTYIDLRGNVLSQAILLNSEKELQSFGLTVKLQGGPQYLPTALNENVNPALLCNYRISTSLGGNDGSDALDRKKSEGSVLLYQQKNRVVSAFASVSAQSSQSCSYLYTIDAKHVQHHFSETTGHPLIVNWLMRPGLGYTSEGGQEDYKDNSWMSSPVQMRYDVVLETPNSSTVLYARDLSLSSCMFNCHDYNSTWTKCQAIIRDIPAKGNISIIVYPLNGSLCPLEMQACDCIIYASPSNNWLPSGGDYDGWTYNNNAITSTLPSRHQEAQGYSIYNKMQASRLLDRNAFDYKICRIMQWSGKEAVVGAHLQLNWQCKLMSNKSSGSSSTTGADSGVGDDSMGFEWILMVESAQHGPLSLVSKGKCMSSDFVRSPEEKENSLAVPAMMGPWVWQQCSTTMDTLNADMIIGNGDSIILLCRPKSQFEDSLVGGDNSSSSCSVCVRDAQLSLSVSDVHEGNRGPCVDRAVSVYMQHNTPSLALG